MSLVDFCCNSRRIPPAAETECGLLGPRVSRRVRSFHQSFAEYAPTPLVRLHALARFCGLGGISVKDESLRFGLDAFKVLGCTWATARCLASRLGISADALTVGAVFSEEARSRLGNVTLVTATDGNHGRALAWTAQKLGLNAVVFMPRGAASSRQEKIRETGAVCTETDQNYDDTVSLAARYAAANNGILIQDTAWDGYEEVPQWIMEGYTTLADEADEQIRQFSPDPPSHVFLQAGVGSFAAAIQAWHVMRWKDKAPLCVLVEPAKADCIFRSIKVADGLPRSVSGNLETIMAGLSCGKPSTLGWKILQNHVDVALSCDDSIAASGVRILAAPRPGDPAMTGGESGAVTAGALEYIMRSPHMACLRAALKLGPDAHVLLVNTEGATDPEQYEKIVWHGLYPQTEEQELQKNTCQSLPLGIDTSSRRSGGIGRHARFRV